MLGKEILFGLVAAAMFVAPLDAVPETEDVQGRIAAAAGRNMTVVAKNGDNVNFLIADDCQITLDGQPAQRDKLAVGLFVAVTAIDEGQMHIAKRIVARSQE